MDPGELIVRAIGKFGRWQLLIILAIFASKFAVAWHQLLMIIESPPPGNFTCKDSQYEKCDKKCPGHNFDRSIFTETIITEWNLVCEHAWLANLTQTFVMLGILFGNVSFGFLSDRFGRRRPLVFAIILQVVSGVAASFSPWLWLYIIFRFLSTLATGGTMLTTFVILMEFTAKEYRTIVGVLFQVPFNIGHAALGLVGYLLRDWHHMQMAVSIPQIILVSYWCILPESPRWLLTTGRTEETIKMLEGAAKCNKLPTDTIRGEVESFVQASADKKIGTGNLLDLVRTTRMRTKTICLCINWFVVSMCFFGMSQLMGQIGGDLFINTVAAGLIQIPGNILAILTMDRIGRKWSLITGYVICFVPCIIMIFLPKSPVWPTSVMGCIGVMGIFMSFSIVYVYTGEMYPTVIRNVGIGVNSMIARVGSMIAPFITQLKDVEPWLPPLFFAALPIVSTVITLLFLPETFNVKMPDKIEEADQL